MAARGRDRLNSGGARYAACLDVLAAGPKPRGFRERQMESYTYTLWCADEARGTQYPGLSRGKERWEASIRVRVWKPPASAVAP